MIFPLVFEVEESIIVREFSKETNNRLNEGSNVNVVMTGNSWVEELNDSLLLVVLLNTSVPVWVPFAKTFFSYTLKKGLLKKGYEGLLKRLNYKTALWRVLNGSR